MTVGNELRDARERLALTREHISLATKISVRKIGALEEDAFESLPTGIYPPKAGNTTKYADINGPRSGGLRRPQICVSSPSGGRI
jgi:hypothetical protein